MSDSPYVTQRERREVEKDWPSHIWSLGMDRLDLLGLDSDGNLYWDGKPVEVKRALKPWQRVGAIVVSISAVVAAIATCVSAYADLMSMP